MLCVNDKYGAINMSFIAILFPILFKNNPILRHRISLRFIPLEATDTESRLRNMTHEFLRLKN